MHDEIIPRRPTCGLLDHLPAGASSQWQVKLYDNGYHMLTRDLQADVVLRDIADWLLQRPALVPSDPQQLTQFCSS
jgi:alpha-beta hydrolase superfamily lysophospholipase